MPASIEQQFRDLFINMGQTAYRKNRWEMPADEAWIAAWPRFQVELQKLPGGGILWGGLSYETIGKYWRKVL